MANRRNRNRRPARRTPWREPKPRILCVCEGEVTEPEYLCAFAKLPRNSRIEVVVEPGAGVPRTLVEKAKERKQKAETDAGQKKDTNLAFEEVWCVYDIDEHPKLDQARVMARDNGIALAVSNPSFELWLVHHFRDSPGMQHRVNMTRILKQVLPGYDKHIVFGRLEPGYQEAKQRARSLEERAEADGDPGRNPTTGFWRLTESIRIASLYC